MKHDSGAKGQSLAELVVAMAIFSFIALSLGSSVLANFGSARRSSEYLQAGFLLQESSAAARSLARSEWNALRYEQSAITAGEESWLLAGEGTSEQIGRFSRILKFFPVYRNGSGGITDQSAGTKDPLSLRAYFSVEWEKEDGKMTGIAREFLLTAWSASAWKQSDWSGGAGFEAWEASLQNTYESDDGNIDFSSGVRLSFSDQGYSPSGSLYSSVYDAGKPVFYAAASLEGSIPSECSGCIAGLQVKTADSEDGSPAGWSQTWSGPDGEDGDEDDFYPIGSTLMSPDHNGDRFIRYRIILSGDYVSTPALDSIRIYFQ